MRVERSRVAGWIHWSTYDCLMFRAKHSYKNYSCWLKHILEYYTYYHYLLTEIEALETMIQNHLPITILIHIINDLVNSHIL